LVSARIDEEIDATFDELGDREQLAPLIGRRSQAHELVLASAPSAMQGRTIRTHGDLHLGQALWHGTVDSAGDWMVIDFEGEPTRAASARRHKAAPLRDVAGMLRSLSYLASAVRRDGTEVPDGWEHEARSSFLGGYRASPAVAVLPSSLEAQEQQLTMFELEKAFYELRYELDHRPVWVDIPVGSIIGLLEGTDG
jgi:predicted trehalose synthase